MEKILRDQKVCEFLESVDGDLAVEVRAGGCEICAGRLHRADFRRKPRGGAQEVMDRWDRRARRGRDKPVHGARRTGRVERARGGAQNDMCANFGGMQAG